VLLLFSDERLQWIFPGSVRPAWYQSMVWQGTCVSDGSIRNLVVVLFAWEIMGDGDSSRSSAVGCTRMICPGEGRGGAPRLTTTFVVAGRRVAFSAIQLSGTPNS